VEVWRRVREWGEGSERRVREEDGRVREEDGRVREALGTHPNSDRTSSGTSKKSTTPN
jgi:hypothetical protein